MPLYNLSWNCWSELLAGGILLDALFSIQGYFICLLLSNSALSDDSGMESRIVKRLHWQLDPLTIRLILISIRLDLIHTRLDLIHIRLDLIYTWPHCKDKMPKIWNNYSQKKTIAVRVPISTFMLWANYMYIPTMGLPFLLEEVCGPMLGIYKSLTDTWMWKLGLRPRNSQKRNT